MQCWEADSTLNPAQKRFFPTAAAWHLNFIAEGGLRGTDRLHPKSPDIGFCHGPSYLGRQQRTVHEESLYKGCHQTLMEDFFDLLAVLGADLTIICRSHAPWECKSTASVSSTMTWWHPPSTGFSSFHSTRLVSVDRSVLPSGLILWHRSSLILCLILWHQSWPIRLHRSWLILLHWSWISCYTDNDYPVAPIMIILLHRSWLFCCTEQDRSCCTGPDRSWLTLRLILW